MKMKDIKNADQVVAEAFATGAVRALFKALYEKSPVGKAKFQEIAKQYGEEAMKDEKTFLAFAEDVCFSGIETTFDSTQGCWIDTEYRFDGLFGIINLPTTNQ